MSRGPPQRRFLGRAHVQLQFGGIDGLRSVAYVAQTFLAHHFPLVARGSELVGRAAMQPLLIALEQASSAVGQPST